MSKLRYVSHLVLPLRRYSKYLYISSYLFKIYPKLCGVQWTQNRISHYFAFTLLLFWFISRPLAILKGELSSSILHYVEFEVNNQECCVSLTYQKQNNCSRLSTVYHMWGCSSKSGTIHHILFLSYLHYDQDFQWHFA